MASPASVPPAPLEQLGEFTLRSVLGRGASGTVFAAWSARHTEVALKVLHAELAMSERERRRFFAEVERMRRVRHPCLVALVDAGSMPDGRPYLCMPLLLGETLASRVARGPLPLDAALDAFAGLADGLGALHDGSLVHRDVKPENVLLDAAGRRAVLLDFGIARELDRPATTTTRAGAARGTPAYMAPERLFGADASVATDVYELAVVLYVMIVGRLPWDASAPDARLRPLSPGDAGVELPRALVTVLMKALSTRPEVRPASARRFADDVRAARAATTAVGDGRAIADLDTEPEPLDLEPAPSPAAGLVVAGRYRLERRLGRGGMGEVWAATHTVTRKAVALKFLRRDLARNPVHRRRFIHEARAASQVRHPNVVQIHDVLELPGGAPVMVMDRLEGESLGDRLARGGALTLRETSRVMRPVLAAVSAAHRCGVVHRDLKPDNIFLARIGEGTRVVVLDFGIAKLTAGALADRTGTLTMEGTMLGTPYYMAPEQIFGDPDVDERCDIWALGIVLYECLSGRRPTQADHVGQVLKIVTLGEIVPIGTMVPGLPQAFASLVMAMLSRDREARPASLEHAERLVAACSEGDVRARRSTGWVRAGGGVLIGAACALVLIGVSLRPAPRPAPLDRDEVTTLRDTPREVPVEVPPEPPLHGTTPAPPPPAASSSARVTAARPAPPKSHPSAARTAAAQEPASAPDSWLDQR